MTVADPAFHPIVMGVKFDLEPDRAAGWTVHHGNCAVRSWAPRPGGTLLLTLYFPAPHALGSRRPEPRGRPMDWGANASTGR